jgi:hypothetical protein
MIVEGTSFRLRGSMGQDVTENIGLKFKYIRPDGAQGEWSAVPEVLTSGSMYTDVPATATKGLCGEWLVWGVALFSATKEMKTLAESMIVVPEGTRR